MKGKAKLSRKLPWSNDTLKSNFREIQLTKFFAEGTFYLALAVAAGQGLALIVQFFTSRQGKLQLGTAVFKVKTGGNGR